MPPKALTKGSMPGLKVLNSPWFIVSLFAVLGLIGILNHVMWRDEFNTWLIVRDSQSLGEMLARVKYQGHTALWSLCVSFLRNFSESPVIMQLFHWAIAVTAMIVFWRYSPFTHRQKVLFTFGYIPFYQYLLIARPYVLGMLFLFVFCAVFPYRKKSYIPAAILIALMANSNAYALFIATALLAMLGLEFIFDREQRSTYWQQSAGYDLALSLGILAIGYGSAIYILMPPLDSTNHGGVDAWKFHIDFQRAFRTIGRLFAGYTLVVPHGERWPDLIAGAIATTVAVGIFILKLSRKPVLASFYILATLEILAFTYFRYLGGGPRHFGHFYLALIATFWLASYLPDTDVVVKAIGLPPAWPALGHKLHKPLFNGILIIQFLIGLYGLPRDLIIPFSASREVVNYLQANGWQDEFIVASRDANMAAIAGYLNRQLYYPEIEGMGSFTLYREERQDVSHEEVLAQIQDLLTQRQDLDSVLLLLHKPLQAQNPTLTIQPLRDFTHAWTDTEHYFLYRVSR